MEHERQQLDLAGWHRWVPTVLKAVIVVSLLTFVLTIPAVADRLTGGDDVASRLAGSASLGESAAGPGATSATDTATPPLATSSTTSTTSSAPETGAGGLVPAVRLDEPGPQPLSNDYVATDVGCATDLSAAGLAAFFREPLGAIKGFDGPRLYPLPDGRTVWMLQDTFIDFTGTATSFANMYYANSTALVQEGKCFTALQRGTPDVAESFEQGDGEITYDRYFWPAGGTVSDGQLQVFWMEMIRDPEVGTAFDGISLHPQSTWLATYDAETMQRISFEPAANPGVSPVYGYTVVDDGPWSYLFGNSYQQNLALEGGYANGPHSATKMYLARVPRGQLEREPSYWDGRGWSSDPDEAEPISSRYWTENSMLPVVIDGRWVSATKVDGFLGSGISIDVADDPWGPYETVDLLSATPRGANTDIVTYHALILPWLDPSGDLIVSLSQIPLALGADSAPPLYRPSFFTVELDE